MSRAIKNVAILGSGVMGSRIACHFANIGVKVLLLDIVPGGLSPKEEQAGLDLSHPAVRNRVVTESFTSVVKSKPSPLYHKDFASRVTLGNFEDDLSRISDCDWILEAVVENLDIKKKVFDNVEKFRKPGSLITSNTSGIPVHLMLDGRSDDFAKNFCGTHFFNPPRYLRLLEIIPTPKTDPEVIEFLMSYGDLHLGKTTVLCKDTPAFIANRIGIFGIMKIFDSMTKLGLNIDQVDKLTGPVIGRPKSATFRTSDVVGLDTLSKVATNLYQALENDESRDLYKLPEFIVKMEENKWLGEKSGQGFYRKTKDDKGKTQILTLDLDSMEYKPKQKVKFPTLEMTKPIDNVKDRFKVLLSGQDIAGEFYRDSFYGLFQYVSNRIPEIADEIYKIDDAVCAGFGWDIGPFETWDQLGLKPTLEKMNEAGYPVNSWIQEMIEKGNESFYRIEDGIKKYYDSGSGTYKPIPGKDGFIILDNLRENKLLWNNDGASILDLGDGVLNVEFHTKMNTLGTNVNEGINRAISMAEKDYRGLVIGNNGANFSVGANLGLVFMFAIEQDFDELDLMIRTFQNTIIKIRNSSIPVAVAPHGMTLGGGCEMTMHADHVQAAAETYIGLVEVGAGVIPAGGGSKEIVKRIADSYEEGDVELNALMNVFMNVATAKVATSGQEAFGMHYLQESDRISVNIDRQISDAKRVVISMSENGYTPPPENPMIRVQGRAGMALFLAGINGMEMAQYASEHDAKIARKLAYVFCGGDLTYPQEVSEQYLLDLEREAFMSLLGEKKTLERIQSIIQGGKPIRN